MEQGPTPQKVLLAGIGLVLAAALARLLPHPWNFTPLGGMALFAGAVFRRQAWSLALPFVALWLSDLVLNNTLNAHYYTGFQWFGNAGVYLAFLGIFLLGRLAIHRLAPGRIALSALAGSLLFFLVTNFMSWWMYSGTMYSSDFAGLLACYTAGIPFFGGTVAGDLFYSALLFGGWAWYTRSQHRLVTI